MVEAVFPNSWSQPKEAYLPQRSQCLNTYFESRGWQNRRAWARWLLVLGLDGRLRDAGKGKTSAILEHRQWNLKKKKKKEKNETEQKLV